MNQPSLDLLAEQLATHLACTQDVVCQRILQALAATGQPLAPLDLASHLQISLEQLADHLKHLPDTEFDHAGNILGWGITLAPTPHQFGVEGRSLFTWCAFDTVLFPPFLARDAQVQGVCAATGQPIKFHAGPEGIQELTPATSVLSLILPEERGKSVREIFCQKSVFFASKRVAAPWMASHPGAVLLSIKEAATLGHLTTEQWSATSNLQP